MPTHHPKLPPPPQPTKIFFDPFNSSSTGHQTAPNQLSGSTSWRQSRGYKLSHQLRDATGHGGCNHLSDLIGAGSENYQRDGRKGNGDWEKGAPGLREKGWQDIRDLMQGSRKRPRSKSLTSSKVAESAEDAYDTSLPGKKTRLDDIDNRLRMSRSQKVSRAGNEPSTDEAAADQRDLVCEKDTTMPPPHQPPQIFRGLTIFLNGSTAPVVSDQRLKQLFATHGGNASLALGRRTVTHVILGNTGGGSLAASKIHKEVATYGGKCIKFVTARWVLDSVEKGIRQPEWRYQPSTVCGRFGGYGQKSVAELFTKPG